MKLQFNIFLIGIIAAFCLTSCLDDKTNMNYADVILPDSVTVTNVTNADNQTPEVKVMYTNGTKSVSFQQKIPALVEIKLEADVHYRGEFPITYEWIYDDEIISTEKVLSLITKEGEHGYTLNIKRGEDRAGANYEFNIIASTAFSTGLFVLAVNNDGETVLDFFKENRELVYDEDGKKATNITIEENPSIYNTANGKKIVSDNPIALEYIERKIGGPAVSAIQILDSDYTKSTSVLAKTIVENASMNDEWIIRPDNLQIKEMASLFMSNLLVGEDGRVFYRVNYDAGYPNTGRYSPEPIGFRGEDGWEEINATNIYVPDLGVLFGLIYEKSKNRFVGLSCPVYSANGDWGSIFIQKLPEVNHNGNENIISLNNFDKEIVSVYRTTDKVLNIIYEDNGSYKRQFVKLNGASETKFDYELGYSELLPELNGILSADNLLIRAIKGARIMIPPYDQYVITLRIASDKTLYQCDEDGANLKELISFDRKIVFFEEFFNNKIDEKITGGIYSVGLDDGTFIIVKFLEDEDDVITTTILAEKKYNRFVDAKYIFSNMLMND